MFNKVLRIILNYVKARRAAVTNCLTNKRLNIDVATGRHCSILAEDQRYHTLLWRSRAGDQMLIDGQNFDSVPATLISMGSVDWRDLNVGRGLYQTTC